MARTIEIDAEILFNVLDLIDERADGLRTDAFNAGSNAGSILKSEVSGEYIALAKAWEADANTIREALGIEIDRED